VTFRYRLSQAAQSDIVDILTWTHANFGEAARQRYEALLIAAIRDLAENPARPGSQARPELGENARCWHLRSSRDRARTDQGIVRRPRHFVIYRVSDATTITIGRILHDAMELERHLPKGKDWG
jgi:toxin ParE1/3/4